MKRRRKFYRGAVNHVYQRTVGWVNIFYCYQDFLVFFTIFSVCAKSADITVLGICLMYDHVHFLVQSPSREELSGFVDRFSSWFVLEYNGHIGRKGKLLHKNFGSAPKRGDKNIRSAINYVGNNPVEKKLCKSAEDYRWNFLKYAISSNPFSEKYEQQNTGKRFRSIIKEVSRSAELNLPLKYRQLKWMTEKLSPKELEQFIDHVITSYSPIDYTELISYYGSYENMIQAMDSNTGSEYEIKEHYENSSHIPFREILKELEISTDPDEIRKITVLPDEEKINIYRWIKQHFSLDDWMIRKFLHM